MRGEVSSSLTPIGRVVSSAPTGISSSTSPLAAQRVMPSEPTRSDITTRSLRRALVGAVTPRVASTEDTR